MDLDLATDDLLPIVQIESNQICNDCGKNNPHWCSITNAVFICPSCARTHKKFNKKISTIKSLEVDEWSKDEINILKLGGNERFNKLIKSYNIPLTKDNKEYKYYTKAAQYYRDILLEESKNKDINNIKKPSLKEGIEILYQDEYLNLFNKNELNEINNNDINNNNEINDKDKKNWMDKMINKLQPDVEPPKEENPSKGKQFLNNMMYAFNDVKELTKEIDFKGKIKKAGEYVSDKTEQIQNSDAFNRFMTVVSNGIDNVIQTTDKLLFKNGGNKPIPVPQNYINPSLLTNDINQINKSNYAPISGDQNKNNIINENIKNINENEQKNLNLNSINSIKKDEEKNNIQNDISQQNKEKKPINKEEKLDEDDTNLKNNQNNLEEKLDENDENTPNSLLIMSNIPNHD